MNTPLSPNKSLGEAMGQLTAAGAEGLPSGEEVSGAKDGSSWMGHKKDASDWKLTKFNANNYSCEC